MEGCVGEESFQLWELNRRLEAYLTRVKTLEEQNQLLSAELGGLRTQSGDASWRARADDELAALRVLVDQRWREKHEAEVQRDNLAEELEGVAGRCQQVRLSRDRTSEEVACSRRALEAEKSAQGWLSTRVAELERELEAVRAANEEERAHLNAQAACAPPRLAAPPHGPPVRAPEVEELARRLGEAWRGAVRDYQERVAHMESSLGQARERLARAMQGAREGRLELLQLQAERDGLQERREALEQRLEGRWQDRLQATEKFQLAVDALEQEKQGLQSQIAQILEGGQQLAHLKMSLSLEVATYSSGGTAEEGVIPREQPENSTSPRGAPFSGPPDGGVDKRQTLLEAENSRLQTPARSSQASRGFHDPKLKLHFLRTPEDQHLGSVLPVLSPTPLPSPVPNTLETPVTAFLKTQGFLQAQTPTLASTPIPPMPEAPCPTKAEVRAQDAPLSLLQTQGGRQQGPELLWTKATVSVSTSEEPGGKQLSHLPKDLTSSAHPVLETKDEESSESRVSSIFQEDEGQIWELVEKEAAIEVKGERSSAQETQEDGLDMEEIQDSQGPLQKETLEAPEEEPLMSLKIQNHETPGKENCNSLRSIDQTLGTLKSSEEKQTLLKSLEEKDVESEKTLERGLPELSKPLGKEDPGIEDDQELISPENTLETVSSIGKENQEVVRSSEENLEPSTAFEKKSQHPLGCPEEENQIVERLIEKEGQEFLRSLEEEDQETYRCLEKENGEPLKSVEKEDQLVERLIEKEGQESLRSLEEEDQSIVKPLERENQESLRSLDEIQETIIPPGSKNQKQLKSLEIEEEQRIVKPLVKEVELLRSLEDSDQMTGGLVQDETQESLRSHKDRDQETQDPQRSLEDNDQMTGGLFQNEIQESLRSHKDRDQETQDPQRSLEEEGQGIVNYLEKEDQEFLGSLEEEQMVKQSLERESHKPLSSVEKKDWVTENLDTESQDSGKSFEEENQQIFRSLGKETPESLWSPEERDQEIQRSLQQETGQIVRGVGDEQLVVRQPELETPFGRQSPVSLEGRAETVKSSDTENIEPLKSAEAGLQTVNSVQVQEPLWSPEVTRETAKPLENEIQESLGYVYGNQETLRPLERENQELRSLGKWSLETADSLEGMGAAGQQLEAEDCLDRNEQQESARSLAEVGQELPGSGKQQRWEDMVEDGAVNQDPVLGRTGVESEEEAELPLTGQSGKEEAAEDRELWLQVTGEACSLGSSEPKEQRVPSEEGAEAFQDMEGPAEQVETLEVPVAQGTPEVAEPLLQDEAMALTGEQDSKELALGSEAATRDGLEQEVIGLGEPKHLSREEAMHPSLGEQSVEVKIAQDLEGPSEAGTLESEIFELPKTSRDALEPKSFKESEPAVGWGGEEASVETDHEGSAVPQPRLSETEEDEDAQAVPALPGPKFMEPSSYIPALEDACELQPQAEEIQEAGWQLGGGSEALRKVGDEQEFGLGETPEGLQDWEESREESEADELGETLPDSTPLGLYLRSPTSPKWDLAGEKRLSPQGEAREEGWGPPVLSNPPGEEKQGPDSDLSSEEFEDLGTEASFLPGVPKGAADHLGQVPSVQEPECWDQGGESDGFADEEESGEEGEEHEEEAESGAQWWGPGPSGGGFKVQDITQRGDLLEQGSVGVSGPWDDGLRGTAANSSVTALDTESQDSAESSGSEEPESVSLEGEDHLGAPQEVTSTVPGVGDTQSPNSELEHMNGRVENGLEQSEGQEGLDGDQDQGCLLQEQEVGALKAPLVVSPVHLGPSQSLEFPLSGVDGDSWSSEED